MSLIRVQYFKPVDWKQVTFEFVSVLPVFETKFSKYRSVAFSSEGEEVLCGDWLFSNLHA